MSKITEVSFSRIRSWRRCKAQYHYSFVENLERKRPRLQLVRGSMIGECLDAVVHRRTFPTDTRIHWTEVQAKYLTEYRRLFEEEREYYGDIIHDVGNIIARYERIYENDGLTYHVQDGRSSELELRIPLSDNIVFTGHMDKYPRDKQGRFWVMDHKTHKVFPDETARYADLQLVFYYWGAPLSGFPKPTGVVWDYIRTKPPAVPELLKNGELSQRASIDTDYNTYMMAIKQNRLDPKNYLELLKRLKDEGSTRFLKRVFLPSPSKALVNSVVRDIRETAQEIHFLGGKAKARNMSRDCKSCSYFELCSAEARGLDADFIRKTEYVQRKPREVIKHDHTAAEED